jgi:hypothetical protein
MYSDGQIGKAIRQQELADRERLLQNQCAAQAGISGSSYRPSPQEEAEKSASYHFEQGQKASEGARFLAENPQFNEFIRLIRSGSISI